MPDFLPAISPPSLSPDLALLLGLALGVLVCLPRPLWRLARLLVTAAHELGHVALALVLGGKVSRVDLFHSTAGLTTYRLPGGAGAGRVAMVALAGYPAPGLAGLAGAFLIAWLDPAWWTATLAVVAVVLLVLWVRNLWGVLSTLLTAGVLLWVASVGSEPLVNGVAGATAALLLAGGWRAALEHALQRERSGRVASDSTVAAHALRVPAAVWRGMFFLLSTVTLLVGSWLLLGRVWF